MGRSLERGILNIASIYEPIQQEMARVEESLSGVSQVEPPILSRLLEHVLGDGGKRIRPAIALLCGKLGRGKPELLVPVATAVELLHTATLVHDDAVDNSPIRRGRPTVSATWGDVPAVLLGDYLFANSARITSEVGNLTVMRLFAEAIMTISTGELMERFGAYDWTQGREQYYQRIARKTASLFSLAAEVGAVLSNAPRGEIEAPRRYGYNLGMAFQVVDDILDFIGDEAEMGKPVGGDLAQGTLTLPAMILMARYPEDNPIRGIYLGGQNEAKVKQAIEAINNFRIIEECYLVSKDFCSRACQALKDLPDSLPRRSLLDLAEYVVERRR